MSHLNVTATDIVNAALYGSQFVTKYRHDTQGNETRWTLPHYELHERPAIDSDFYVPPKLKGEAKIYSLQFPQNSCLQLGCYFYHLNEPCASEINKRQGNSMRIDGVKYNCCQDYCYLNPRIELEFPFQYETYFQNGKCKFRNAMFKRWCIAPQSRTEEPVNIPPFKYNEIDGSCNITKKYCQRYGLDFDNKNNDCYLEEGQKWAEIFIGRTIIRGMKRRPIEDPDYDPSYSFMSYGGRLEAHEEFLYSILADAGLEASKIFLKHVSLKTISMVSHKSYQALITKFGSKAAVAVARAAAVSTVLHTLKGVAAAQTALRVAGVISTLGSVVGWSMFAISLVSLVLDLVDPEKYSTQKGKDIIEQINTHFKSHFNKTFEEYYRTTNARELEYTPEFAMNLASDGTMSDAELAVMSENSYVYLDSLEFNSEGAPAKVLRTTGITVETVISRINKAKETINSVVKPKLWKNMSKIYAYTILTFVFLLALYMTASI